jgi:hypothetical protein
MEHRQAAPPTKAMIRAMLDLQVRMNRKINPEWRSAGYEFLRAVLVEAVEALDHYGWKWWKGHEPNIEQLKIELIDIWHFLLSHFLCEEGDPAKATERIWRDWQGPRRLELDGTVFEISATDLRRRLEILAACSALRRVSLPLFSSLLDDCGLDAEQLYRAYVSKNVLNHFRQDHGYKSGAYEKIWEGREDNEHMVEMLSKFGATSNLADVLYEELERKYRSLRPPGSSATR